MARGKGEHSLFYSEKRGLWIARIELAPLGGERRRKQITGKDKAKLIARMREMDAQLKLAGDIPTASLSVDQWMTYWMKNHVTPRKRPSTARSYQSLIDNHITPVIGKVRLERLTPSHIVKVTNGMQTSTTTALHCHNLMSGAFTVAEREGRIGRNPVSLVEAPLKAIPKLEVLTTGEARNLLAQFRGQPDFYLWATLLLTGARRSEILGLEWSRIELENEPHIDLSWQMQRIKFGQTIPSSYAVRQISDTLYWTPPKSRAGWRVIPLVDPLLSILRAWKAEAPHNEWDLVFTRPDRWENKQLPIAPDYATRMWPRVLKACGIAKNVRLHDIRHTTVDLLLEAGVPEDIIQEIVGHSTRAMVRAYKSKGNRQRIEGGMRQLSELLELE